MGELLGWLRGVAGAKEPEAAAVEAVLLDRFGRDRLEVSDVFELSFSATAGGADVYRYSYAFPRLRVEPAGVGATLTALAAAIGPVMETATRAILRAARAPVVEQLLFGLAHDGVGGIRPKLYVQLGARDPVGALALAERILGRGLGEALAGAGDLHLIGLDFGAGGLRAAKLYFVTRRIATAEIQARFGPCELVRALADAGKKELRDVLAIHRLEGPDDEGLARPVEIDFSLPDNDLRWDDVRELAPVRERLAASPELGELERRYRIAVRRISAGLRGVDKLNVYYVLAEIGASSPVPYISA